MKKFKFYLICSGLFSIVTGLMLAILRGDVLSLIITVLGIGFIVSGLAFGIKHLTKFSLLKIIIGICTVAFGNTYINLSMYILGIALIILGIFRLSTAKSSGMRFGIYAVLSFVFHILPFVAGICIFLAPMGSVELLFLLCGILLAASGVWDLYRGIKLRL